MKEIKLKGKDGNTYGIKFGNIDTLKKELSNKSAVEDIIKECGCKNCRDKRMCNGIDLMNCYAKKKLTIKGNSSCVDNS